MQAISLLMPVERKEHLGEIKNLFWIIQCTNLPPNPGLLYFWAGPPIILF